MSSSVTSSPVLGSFPESVKAGRGSPAPPAAIRPASSRARQNSTQSNVDNGRQRPSSSASNKPNGNVIGTPDVTTQNGVRIGNEAKPQKETPSASKSDVVKSESEMQATSSAAPNPNGGKKENTAKPTEEKEPRGVSSTPVAQPTAVFTVTTKSGRASKPSTPALATFAEAATARSRPSRASESTHPPVKRSHKKGASAAAAAAMAVAAQQAATEGEQSAQDDEEADIDGDEPRYCYCNNVSYGEMVACDADGCKREWFHLECVGLKVAPKGNDKSTAGYRLPRLRTIDRLEQVANKVIQRNGIARTAKSGCESGERRLTEDKMNCHLELGTRPLVQLSTVPVPSWVPSVPTYFSDGHCLLDGRSSLLFLLHLFSPLFS